MITRAFTVILLSISAAFAGDNNHLTIVYTSSLSGNMDSCACKSSPKGGLVKRGTAIRNLRKKYSDIVLVDTGDYMPTYIDTLLPEYIIKGYAYLKYDALSFGDQDLDIGVAQFFNLTADLPIISSNMSFISGAHTLPAYRIVKKGGITTAILSIQDPDSFKYALSKTKEEITIEPITSSLNRTVSFVRDKERPDAVILLCHASLQRTIEIEKDLEGIDVIIGGHDQSFTANPINGVRSLIAFAGSNGVRIGIMELDIRGGKISLKSNTFIRPDRTNTKDDKYIRALIDKYRNTME